MKKEPKKSPGSAKIFPAYAEAATRRQARHACSAKWHHLTTDLRRVLLFIGTGGSIAQNQRALFKRVGHRPGECEHLQKLGSTAFSFVTFIFGRAKEK